MTRFVSVFVHPAECGCITCLSLYAIEHDYMDTSFVACIWDFLPFFLPPKDRRDLLLGQLSPEFDTSLDAAIADRSG